jgi:hypothetical protein
MIIFPSLVSTPVALYGRTGLATTIASGTTATQTFSISLPSVSPGPVYWLLYFNARAGASRTFVSVSATEGGSPTTITPLIESGGRLTPVAIYRVGPFGSAVDLTVTVTLSGSVTVKSQLTAVAIVGSPTEPGTISSAAGFIASPVSDTFYSASGSMTLYPRGIICGIFQGSTTTDQWAWWDMQIDGTSLDPRDFGYVGLGTTSIYYGGFFVAPSRTSDTLTPLYRTGAVGTPTIKFMGVGETPNMPSNVNFAFASFA